MRFWCSNKHVSNGRGYVWKLGDYRFMWGFGMRYAITSGVFAAKSILGECDYEREVRNRLLPLVKASAINRFLLNRVGDRGFKLVANYWMRDQRKKGDGLAFMKWLYQPGILRRALWPITRIGMLRKNKLGDGRIVHRMPFRKSLKRDDWEQSIEAEIGNQWNHSGAGSRSFSESTTSRKFKSVCMIWLNRRIYMTLGLN